MYQSLNVSQIFFLFEIDMSEQASCDVTRAPRVAVEKEVYEYSLHCSLCIYFSTKK